MKRIFHVLLLSLLCSTGAARGEEGDLEEEGVAAADLALIDRVARALPPKGNVRGLGSVLGRDAPDETRDLAFDVAWRRYELYGEALTIWVDVVSWRDRVAGLRIRALDDDAPLVAAMRGAWGRDLRRVEGGAELRRLVPRELERVRRATRRGLGKAPAVGPRASLAQAVALLTDPLSDLTYGRMCYEDGSAPPGREAANLLYREGSPEAAMHVLVGPNPEGRVYAAEALLLLERESAGIGADRKAVLEKVVALEVPIRSCDGCLVHDALATQLLQSPPRRSLFLAEHYLCRIVERIDDGMGPVDVGVLDVLWDGRLTYRPLPRVALACIPIVIRATLPSPLIEDLEGIVRAGAPFVTRDGVPQTVVRVEDPTDEIPKAVRAALEHARALRNRGR